MKEDQTTRGLVIAVTRSALLLASPDFLDEIAERLRDAGLQDAVAHRRSEPIYNHMVQLIALQGISDAAAFGFDAVHGGITAEEIAVELARCPSCPKLRSYWSFSGCGYRKGAGTCGEPRHRSRCPLPRHKLRKGGLNQAAYALFLFIRDVCRGDLVGWIDERLRGADPGRHHPGRLSVMREALLGPLTNIAGSGRKLWSMMLPGLLLGGDPDRERWVATGSAFVAIDTLVHNHLQRTGILRRLGCAHPYGESCYRPNGCAEVIEQLARRIDARAFNPSFPAVFPRFIQHALWAFCAAGGRDICNGNRIDDRHACAQLFCPASPWCDRVPLRSPVHDGTDARTTPITTSD